MRLLAIAIAACLFACGAAPVRPASNAYGDRARADYENAMQALEGGDFTDATERFQRVRREFGLSRFAWLAELRIADADFKQEHFAAALQGYRSWIRYHPTQPEVDYANYMIARSYFGEIPSEWLLAPAAHERDLSAAHDAEDALTRFIDDYGHSPYATDARDYLRRTRELLARAEISIGLYYHSRRHDDAAIARYRTVLESYRGSGLEAEALVRIGETYLAMRHVPEARTAFEMVLGQYPTSAYAHTARRYLRFVEEHAAP